MEKMDDCVSEEQKQTSTKEKPMLAFQRCIKLIAHAGRCKGGDCGFHECQRMKNIIRHHKRCSKQRKTNVACPICKQLVAICCYHSSQCQETACFAPFCTKLKTKMRLHVFQRRLEESKKFRRHVRNFLMRTKSGGLSNPKHSKSSSQSLPSAQPHASSHFQPDTAKKPSSGLLSAGQQMLAAAARQIVQRQIQNTQPFFNFELGLEQLLQVTGGYNSVSSSISSAVGAPQLMSNPGPSVDDIQKSTQG